jgi:hypothetical protein
MPYSSTSSLIRNTKKILGNLLGNKIQNANYIKTLFTHL